MKMTHVATLRAYSFPIVIRAFKTYGLPGQLEGLAAQETGPLAVALAAEFASITTWLLVGTLRRIRLESRSQLSVPQGFEEVDPRDVLDQALRERNAAYVLVENMERYIQSLLPDAALIFVNELGSIANQNCLAGEIARMPPSWPFKQELQSLLPTYYELSARHTTAVNRHRACRNVAPIEEMLRVGEKGKVPSETTAWPKPQPPFDDLRIDFFGSSPILDRGFMERLRRNNLEWLVKVTSYIQGSVRVNLENNTIKILLRHPSVVREILCAQKEWSKQSSVTQASISLEILKRRADHDFFVPSDWMSTNKVFENFKKLPGVLKSEDRMADKWILSNDSASPFNIYLPKKVADFAWRKRALKDELLRRLERPPLY